MTFWKKLISVLTTLLIILCYNAAVSARNYEEKIDKLNSEVSGLKAQVEYDSRLFASINNEIDSDNSTDEGDNIYKDGEFTGTAKGYGGEIAVKVKISNDIIEDIQVLSAENEDSAYLGNALKLIDDIKEQQSPYVDTVTGATFSSTGIKNAVSSALKEAIND